MEVNKVFVMAVMMSCVLVALPVLGAGQGAANMNRAIEYFQEVAAFVMNTDASSVYNRMTPEVRARLSEKEIKNFLISGLGGLDQPRGINIIGFDVDSQNQYYQVKGQLDYGQEQPVLTVIMKPTDQGFQLQYIHLGFPQGQSRFEQWAQEPKRFLKERFLPTLREKGVEEALNFVDATVRQQVGDDLIRTILSSLRKTTITGIKSYDNRNTTQGKLHQFILTGSYSGTPCEVEFVLRSQKGQFVIMDVNLQLLSQS